MILIPPVCPGFNKVKGSWPIIFTEVYFKNDENLAVLILEARNKQSANRELNKLPFVNKKLIKFDLIHLKPYPGFQRLFR